MNVSGVNGINILSKPEGFGNFKETEDSAKVSFSDIFKNQLNEVARLEKHSKDLTNDFAAGKIDNIHEIMIASEKAGLALELTVQIKNKLTEAYTEIMRMQI